MATIMQLLENALDILGSDCPNINEASDKMRDALYFLAQGHNVDTDVNDSITKYIIPVDVNFEEFKVIINSLWDNAEQIGRFKDYSRDTNRVSFHYQTNAYAKAVAYDDVDLMRWTVNLGRGCFGRGHTVTDALDNERVEALKIGRYTYADEPGYIEHLTFEDFKACVKAQLENAEEVGTFIDDSECYIDDDPKRYVYYWASNPVNGCEFIEYDSGNAPDFQWQIYIGNCKVFGRNFNEVTDKFRTCHK